MSGRLKGLLEQLSDATIGLQSLHGEVMELISEFNCCICGEPLGGEAKTAVARGQELAHKRCAEAH